MNRIAGLSRGWKILVAAILLHVLAFLAIALFVPIRDESLSTMNLYLQYGVQLHNSMAPYRDFQFEYPPLAAPLFWLPVLFARDLNTYRTVFALIMLAFVLFGVLVGLAATRRFGPGVGPWGILFAEPLLLLAAGHMLVFERFDLAAAALMLAAIVLFASGRDRLGWAILGLATAVKLYPAVAAPLLLILAPRPLQKRDWVANLALFAGAVIIPSLIVTQGDLPALSSFVAFHADRGLEIGSSYTSLVMGAKLLGLTGTAYIGQQFGHGASELVAPQAALLARLALPLTVVALLGVYLLAWRERDLAASAGERFSLLIDLSLLAILAFILFGKVLSPQYLLWLVPLVAVLPLRRGEVWVWLGAALVLTRWYYPDHWLALMTFTPLAMTVVILRNTVLLGLAVLILLPHLNHLLRFSFPLSRHASQSRAS